MYEQIVTGALFVFIFEQCKLGQQQQIKRKNYDDILVVIYKGP